MAARKTAEEKAAEAQAAEEQKAAEETAAAEENAANDAADDQPRNADGSLIPTPDENQGDENAPDPKPEEEPVDTENHSVDTIPAVAHSAPAVENAEEIAEKASPNGVTEEDGVAAFRPPQTRHTAWTINTLAESEGGSALGVEQTSGNADVTKDPADRPDADETE